MAPETWNSELKQWLTERSRSLGFTLSGIAAADDPAGAQEASRFEAWVADGRAGEMEYLKRRDEAGRLLRTSVKLSYPWANSVIVLAHSYRSGGPLSIDPAPASAGWIGRYAWSGRPAPESDDSAAPQLLPSDYHDFLLIGLEQLAQELAARSGAAWRCYVDTGPLVERSLAARAGIGWIGKNTCVLNGEHGSWLLLGVILTSLHLQPEYAAIPAPDRCGSCTRCIDACPTGALTAPREMDASRCIAYLTIEKKGVIAPDLRPQIGRQVFGCDICQDVCPWNARLSRVSPPTQPPVREELINPDLEWLASMDAPTFKRWFKASPLERTRRSRLHRNVAIAMGNSGDARFIARLQAWTHNEDPVLAEAAAWALDRLVPNQKISAATEIATADRASATLC